MLEFSGILRILFSCVLARLEFAMLVIIFFRLGLKFPRLFPFLFYFLVNPLPFRFSHTPCCLSNLFCLVYSDSLALDSCCEAIGTGCLFSLDLTNVS